MIKVQILYKKNNVYRGNNCYISAMVNVSIECINYLSGQDYTEEP